MALARVGPREQNLANLTALKMFQIVDRASDVWLFSGGVAGSAAQRMARAGTRVTAPLFRAFAKPQTRPPTRGIGFQPVILQPMTG